MAIAQQNAKVTTRRKVKVIGIEEYINVRTGEVEKFQVIRINDRDANFEKLWISHVLEAIQVIGNAKVKVLLEIIRRRTRDNMVVATYDDIATWAGVSRRTVIETVNALIQHNILKRRKGIDGVLYVNPDVIFKGGTTDRMRVLLDYSSLER